MQHLKSFFSPSVKPFPESHLNLMKSPKPEA